MFSVHVPDAVSSAAVLVWLPALWRSSTSESISLHADRPGFHRDSLPGGALKLPQTVVGYFSDRLRHRAICAGHLLLGVLPTMSLSATPET